jgi:hypothetical protein
MCCPPTCSPLGTVFLAPVVLPIPGTGVVGGTILARLLGFGWCQSFLVVCLGTVIGAYVMAFGAQLLLMIFPPRPVSTWMGILRLGVSMLIIIFLSWVGRQGWE